MQSTNLVNKYLDNVPNQWLNLVLDTYTIISDLQPDLKVSIWQFLGKDLLGWGEATYLASGKPQKWFIIGLGYHKQYCSIYIWGWRDNKSLLEFYKDKLGNVKIGRSCLNFKSLKDINLIELKKIMNLAVNQAH